MSTLKELLALSAVALLALCAAPRAARAQGASLIRSYAQSQNVSSGDGLRHQIGAALNSGEWKAGAGTTGFLTYGPYTPLNLVPTTQTTFTDNSVTTGQTYYYIVRSVDDAGNASAATAPSPRYRIHFSNHGDANMSATTVRQKNRPFRCEQASGELRVRPACRTAIALRTNPLAAR